MEPPELPPEAFSPRESYFLFRAIHVFQTLDFKRLSTILLENEYITGAEDFDRSRLTPNRLWALFSHHFIHELPAPHPTTLTPDIILDQLQTITAVDRKLGEIYYTRLKKEVLADAQLEKEAARRQAEHDAEQKRIRDSLLKNGAASASQTSQLVAAASGLGIPNAVSIAPAHPNSRPGLAGRIQPNQVGAPTTAAATPTPQIGIAIAASRPGLSSTAISPVQTPVRPPQPLVKPQGSIKPPSHTPIPPPQVRYPGSPATLTAPQQLPAPVRIAASSPIPTTPIAATPGPSPTQGQLLTQQQKAHIQAQQVQQTQPQAQVKMTSSVAQHQQLQQQIAQNQAAAAQKALVTTSTPPPVNSASSTVTAIRPPPPPQLPQTTPVPVPTRAPSAGSPQSTSRILPPQSSTPQSRPATPAQTSGQATPQLGQWTSGRTPNKPGTGVPLEQAQPQAPVVAQNKAQFQQVQMQIPSQLQQQPQQNVPVQQAQNTGKSSPIPSASSPPTQTPRPRPLLAAKPAPIEMTKTPTRPSSIETAVPPPTVTPVPVPVTGSQPNSTLSHQHRQQQSAARLQHELQQNAQVLAQSSKNATGVRTTPVTMGLPGTGEIKSPMSGTVSLASASSSGSSSADAGKSSPVPLAAHIPATTNVPLSAQEQLIAQQKAQAQAKAQQLSQQHQQHQAALAQKEKAQKEKVQSEKVQKERAQREKTFAHIGQTQVKDHNSLSQPCDVTPAVTPAVAPVVKAPVVRTTSPHKSAPSVDSSGGTQIPQLPSVAVECNSPSATKKAATGGSPVSAEGPVPTRTPVKASPPVTTPVPAPIFPRQTARPAQSPMRPQKQTTSSSIITTVPVSKVPVPGPLGLTTNRPPPIPVALKPENGVTPATPIKTAVSAIPPHMAQSPKSATSGAAATAKILAESIGPKTPAFSGHPHFIKRGHGTNWTLETTPSTPGQAKAVVDSPSWEPLSPPPRASPTPVPSSANVSVPGVIASAIKSTRVSRPETPGSRGSAKRSSRNARNSGTRNRRSQSVGSQPDEHSLETTESQAPSTRIKREVGTPVEETGDTTADDESWTGSRRRGPSVTNSAPRKRKRDHSMDSAHTHRVRLSTSQPAPSVQVGPPSHVRWTRGFPRVSASVLDQIGSHRDANMFANPIREKDAPNYRTIVLQPVDIASIKKAINHGNKFAIAAAAALPEADQTAPWLDLPISEDLVPPKGIINSEQLERSLVHMFCNAVMYNPDPDRGPGPTFLAGARHGGPGNESVGYQVDEFGVVNDTRNMFWEVDKLMAELRGAEMQRNGGGGAATVPMAGSSVVGEGDGEEEEESEDEAKQEGDKEAEENEETNSGSRAALREDAGDETDTDELAGDLDVAPRRSRRG